MARKSFLILAFFIVLAGCVQDTPPAHELPNGYTLDSYTIEEVTDVACEQDTDCDTPMDYRIQSRCPFTSLCLEGTCAVVCPTVQEHLISGTIISVHDEIDGSMVEVDMNGTRYTVLVSIPNLGEQYMPAIQAIAPGKYLQARGPVLALQDEEHLIATQLFVEGVPQGEHPCTLLPDPGQCEAAMPRYYYDKTLGQCEEFLWGGCDGTVPFDSLDVCQSTCERVIPEKPALTQERCEADGGRVVNPPQDECGEEEIAIGLIEDSTDCPCICCMVAGGMASR